MSRRGNASIEFALATPLVLMVLAGIVDGGSYLVCRHAVGRAARDGARVGAITTEPPPANGDEIVANAQETAEASLVAAGFGDVASSVTAKWSQDSDNNSWLMVNVTVEHTSMFGIYSVFDQDVRSSFVIYTQEQIN